MEALSAGNPRIDRALIGQEARQRPYILVGRGMEGSDVEFDLGQEPHWRQESLHHVCFASRGAATAHSPLSFLRVLQGVQSFNSSEYIETKRPHSPLELTL
jgi:hypothetical protein